MGGCDCWKIGSLGPPTAEVFAVLLPMPGSGPLRNPSACQRARIRLAGKRRRGLLLLQAVSEGARRCSKPP